MNSRIKQIFILFLALAASLFLLDAFAGKPVKVTVTAAVPDTAVQGDMTEVEIDGTGFDAGSTARFIVTDTRDDTQIDVNEVTFDAATGKLKAKIKVKDAAQPVEYDIEVKTSSGRRGKGTTLFRVRERASNEPIQLGPGDDEWPGPGDDNFGDETVSGGDGDDIIYGGLGDDHLYGENGEDILDGGDGNDLLNGGPGYDLLFGGAGDDSIYLPVFGETEMDFVDGGGGSDLLRLNTLESVDLDVRTGLYTGHYFVVDKRTSTKVSVNGEFNNIERFLCATRGGTYHGDDSDNEFWGYGGEHVMFGEGGNDKLTGGFADSGDSDYLDGGDGDDQLQGVYGDDYLIGGPGRDTIYIRKGLGHDVVEDFTTGEDIISIFNSDICFQDLHMSLIAVGGDNVKGDTYITWPVKKKLNTVSITLIDVEPQDLSETDFDFTWDPLSEFSSDCP